MTVLLWIRSYAQKHQLFVANRVAESVDSSTVDQWPIQPETLSRTEETFAIISDETKVTIDLTRFSSYVRLRNVVTTVLS